MKTIYIIHNPSAGDSRHLKEDIYKIFDSKDYNVKYISTHKDNWEKFDSKNIDVICAAGGDGTIHKVVEAILDRGLDKGIPIKILPLGTANNIARTLLVPLEVDSRHDELPEAPKLFDLGQIKGIKDKSFFLESVGFGIFPKLILEMQKNKPSNETPDQKVLRSLKVLSEVAKDFKAEKTKIKTNGILIKGSFLLVELMNIQLLGPNLRLAPEAEVGDGYLNLVIIPEKNRAALIEYLQNIIKKRKQTIELNDLAYILKVGKAKIKYAGSHIHIDDNLYGNPNKRIIINTIPKLLRFG